MLWYKSWLETRWRFLIGLALLVCSSIATVLVYPQVLRLLPAIPAADPTDELGRRVKEAAELARDYRGYVWSQWFSQNMTNLWTVFAVLLGTSGLLSQSPVFTLSMPASRSRLVGTRVAWGLGELFLLAVVPSLLIPVFSLAVGQSYSIADALIHAACLFLAGGVFFSLAFLLSTVFADLWRPLLTSLAVCVLLGTFGQLFPDASSYSVFGVMNGESYFRSGHIPWSGLLVAISVSAAMLYGAAQNMARRDF